MADTVDDSVSKTVTDLSYTYGTNDVCFIIYPYDNYKKIALYNRDSDGNDVAFDIDRNDSLVYSLEFGDGTSSTTSTKKVKISECTDYTNTDGDYIQLASNELLFKITQEEAYKILNLSSRVFNVVREVVTDDDLYASTTTEIQTMFQGKWATLEEADTTDSSKLIQELKDRVSDLLDTNEQLNKRLLELMQEIADLEDENATLQEYAKYKDMYEELLNEKEAEEASTYTGTAIDYNAKYITVNIDDETLANQVNDYLDTVNS